MACISATLSKKPLYHIYNPFEKRAKFENQQRHASMTNAEEQASVLCALCSKVENTVHLLFE